ncbi:hypothetical protein DL769_005199 [Monosporascus sp. CRB-8-3]|nr:hypothetical protein DL769_005199 [Monosporascus sp. CRB-8-3]
MTSYLGFLYHQLTYKPRPLPDSLRLDGKTVLVTGSNVGLGLETAKALAARGASRVVLGVRSVSKGEEAKRAVVAAAASPSGCDVRVWPLDHEDWASVVAFAGRAVRELDRGLDVAVLNAGLKRLAYSAAPATGHEAHVQTNHLGTALLSLLLLEPLRRAARRRGGDGGGGSDGPARLTIVASSVAFFGLPAGAEALLSSSDGHENVLARLDDPASFGREGAPERYALSKLLNVLWARALAARVDPARDGVVVDAVNPGYCRSAFHRADPAPRG